MNNKTLIQPEDITIRCNVENNDYLDIQFIDNYLNPKVGIECFLQLETIRNIHLNINGVKNLIDILDKRLSFMKQIQMKKLITK